MGGGTGDAIAHLLLRSGADPNARATLRMRFEWLGGPDGEREHEFRDVTPLAYARQYPLPNWRNEAAMRVVEERV